jgi:subtilase family serine protease
MQANAHSYITSVVAYPNANINDLGKLTPPQVAAAYNIPTSTGANVKVGIISLGGGLRSLDLANSMSNMGLPNPTITTVLVDGATGTFTGSEPDDENTLDVYCVAGMAPSANIVLYIGQNDSITYGTNANTQANVNSTVSFANVINRAVNENCDIITISWGLNEIYSNVYPNYYCGDFLAAPLANAAARGITVLVATGDYGADATIAGNIVSAQYPASSANVVAVGGTKLSLNPGAGNVRISETVEYNPAGFPAGWGGGGGISNFIALPTWQANLTYQQYFYSNSSAGPVTTLTTRGIPDIAAAMNTYALWYNGTVTGMAGTSASAPVMAGMFARFMSLNGGRRPVPNAIHPILYANLAAYYDITTGNNATVQYLNGYAASSNWDPVTGVGVPFGNVVNQMVTSGGTQIKTAANTWNYVANVQVKTGATTWSNVKSIWTKTINGWAQTF